ncbi:MAG: nucleoside diphosphate kinase regulator [Leptolyngbya sp. PLA3]|nr:MAG: nucleoside diphosphate kinase regulator [Cyanobacteria bacterium CYA]MCE7967490.1 nucleoside diphosphate kinase regulator [Leptolyngbya sp. PL-A3]
MNNRTIHVTRQDMERLRDLIASSHIGRGGDDRDRPYLATLAAELDRAVIVAPDEVTPDVVTMNSRIRLRDGRRTWIMSLVYPENADPEEGSISVLAPLGAAILGCRVGQSVAFRVPGGGERTCEILSVLYQPEAAGDLHL